MRQRLRQATTRRTRPRARRRMMSLHPIQSLLPKSPRVSRYRGWKSRMAAEYLKLITPGPEARVRARKLIGLHPPLPLQRRMTRSGVERTGERDSGLRIEDCEVPGFKPVTSTLLQALMGLRNVRVLALQLSIEDVQSSGGHGHGCPGARLDKRRPEVRMAIAWGGGRGPGSGRPARLLRDVRT